MDISSAHNSSDEITYHLEGSSQAPIVLVWAELPLCDDKQIEVRVVELLSLECCGRRTMDASLISFDLAAFGGEYRRS